MFLHIQGHAAHDQLARGVIRRAAGGGTDPRQEFLHGERLCDIIICAGVETFDAVLHLGFGRQHDHRGVITSGPKVLQHLDPVHLRHHDIQDDAVVGLALSQCQCGGAIQCGVHLISGVFQYRRHGL